LVYVKRRLWRLFIFHHIFSEMLIGRTMKITQATAEEYQWGAGCLGWRFVDRMELSVIRERMLPGTSEVRHHHEKSRQFFFILRGAARIESGGEQVLLTKDEGLEIPPGVDHQIFNDSDEDLEFLLVSQPSTKGDRIVSRQP
jgi:mannose-6-phosphate isomerase-like protein (cupin superfamily)